MRATRISAFLIHFGISTAIFLVLLAMVVFVWFRAPLFSIEGGWNGIKIIAGVDLVLGPLLTLIVFKPGKPRLKLDLTIIAFIQTAALIAGTWIVYTQRPVLLVLTEGHFYSMAADTVSKTGLSLADLNKFDDKPYPIAVVNLPADKDERQKERYRSLAKGGLHLRGDLYIPRDANYLSVLNEYSVDIYSISATQPKYKFILDEFIARHGPVADYFFVPINGRRGQAIFALDRMHGEIVERLDIRAP